MLGVENSGKPLGGRGYAPNPAGGAHSTPQTWQASPGGVWGKMSPIFGAPGVQRSSLQCNTRLGQALQ